MMTTRQSIFLSTLLPTLAMLSAGCSEEVGDYEVRIYGEAFIEEGIPADTFADGWSLHFDEFVVVVSGVEVSGSDGSGALQGAFVFDLTHASEGEGQLVGTLAVPAGSYAALDYRVGADADAMAVSLGDVVSASEEQVERMNDEGYTLYVAGQATREGATIEFAWGFSTDTTYVDCETGGSLDRDHRLESQLTIHADHLFYDDLVSADPNVAFDLIASADANMDGVVTEAELTDVDITGETRYQVGNQTDVKDLWAFIEAQTRTVGHIDGEGHCSVQ